ncbi:hypothetical protein Tco_0428164 [Tanacetum coccineum]
MMEAEEDPSNQGRSLIEELDLDAEISLVPPHATDQGRIDDTLITRRRQSVENVQTYTRRRREVSTSSGGVNTASRLVSIADISSASKLDSTVGVKAKDKGKAIMHESESPKKIKKRVQVQMSVDEELANKLDEREEVAAKVDQAHDIDWNDPAVLRYHTLQNRPFSVAEVRKNMCLYLKNQGGYKMSHFNGMSYEDIRPIFERNIVPKDESLDVESLATKYPIVDWETQILANDKYYYQIKRADGSVKHYKLFSAMLYDFDRQDVLELYRLVKERFQIASLEGYDLLLWGDLKTLIEPNEEDEI